MSVLKSFRTGFIINILNSFFLISFLYGQIMIPDIEEKPRPRKKKQEQKESEPEKKVIRESILIDVSSFPTDAEVYLNNDYIGNTPLKIPAFKNDPINLRIQKEAFLTWEKQLIPEDKITLNIELLIIRKSTIRDLTMMIQSTPALAEVIVNRQRIGETPTGFFIKNGKKMHIRVAKPGYASWERTLIAQNDSTFRILLISMEELRRTEYPVFINTWPQNAKIIINNKFIGYTPLGFKTNGGDTLKTRLEKEDYKFFQKDLFIDGRKNIIIDFTTVNKKSPWPWIGGGAAAVLGGVLYYLKVRGEETEPTATEIWPAPPNRP